MAENKVRVVTPEQLAEGFTVLWPSGQLEQFDYYVVKQLPDGNFEAHEPEIGPQVGESGTIVWNAKRRRENA